MAMKVINKKGQEITLLNPAEKGGKFAAELKNNMRYTNDKKNQNRQRRDCFEFVERTARISQRLSSCS